MATHLAIDDKLIIEAQKLGHFKTKRDAVTEALKEYIAYQKQRGIIRLFGTIEFDPSYHYKNYLRDRSAPSNAHFHNP